MRDVVDSPTIYRVIKQSGEFAIIHKSALLDPRLSWKAKGIHTYMLAQKDDWIFHRDVMLNFCSDGKDSLQSGLDELQRYGYASINPEKKNGKITRWITTVYEVSQIPCAQPCGKDAFPETDFPDLEKKDQKPVKSRGIATTSRSGFSRSGKPAPNNNKNKNNNINKNKYERRSSVDNSEQLPTSSLPPNIENIKKVKQLLKGAVDAMRVQRRSDG